jgi:hypothetical protein
MTATRWGIIGCGDVAEVKSGPGFQKARGSALVAVMRRNTALAEDYARRALPRFVKIKELLGFRRCLGSSESGARTGWVMDQMLGGDLPSP